MAKRVSARRVKSNLFYTYAEAGEAVGVSAQTIRSWRDKGMPVLQETRPHGVMGFVLKHYIENPPKKQSIKLDDGEVYCMTCKDARRPFGGMADYHPITATRGRLKTLCDHCGGVCNRLVSVNQLPQFGDVIEIAGRSGTGD